MTSCVRIKILILKEYIWGDEFDGDTLDTAKWDFRTHMMQLEHPGWVKEEGISFDGNSNEAVSKTEQFIYLTTEVNGYRNNEFTATEEARAAVGDQFIVDHVRVFDIKK